MSRVMVGAEGLARALDQVARAASRDRKSPIMQCVLFEADEALLRLVASDSFRLAVSEVAVLEGGAPSFRALVAADLEGLRLEPGSPTVSLSIGGGSLTVEAGDVQHTLALVDGDFPDYEVFLAADGNSQTLVVERSAFLSAIEEMSDDQPVRLAFTAGGLEVGEGTPSRLAADYAGPDISFFLNPDYAHDAVESAAGPAIAIEAAGPLHPVVVRSADDSSYTCVVMPVRVGAERTRRRQRR